MLEVAILCTSCGRKLHRAILDESCAPSRVRCSCGVHYSIKVEDDDPGAPLPDFEADGDEEAFGSDGAPSDNGALVA